MARHKEYYEKVYTANDPKPEGTHGWIQWKGTQVCMDIHCVCSAHLHADEEFFYVFECGECGQKYAVGQHVKMIPLTPELVEMSGREEFVVLRNGDK